MPALRDLVPTDYDLSIPEVAAYFHATVEALVNLTTMTPEARLIQSLRDLPQLAERTLASRIAHHHALAGVLTGALAPTLTAAEAAVLRQETRQAANLFRDAAHRMTNEATPLDEHGRPIPPPDPLLFRQNLEDIRHLAPRTWALHPHCLILDFPDVWFNESGLGGRNSFPLGHYRFTFYINNGLLRSSFTNPSIHMISGNRSRSNQIHTNGSAGTDFCMGITFMNNAPVYWSQANFGALYDLCRGFLTTWNPSDCRVNRTYWFLAHRGAGTEPDTTGQHPVYRPFPQYSSRRGNLYHSYDLNRSVWRAPDRALALFHPEKCSLHVPATLFGMPEFFSHCDLPIINTRPPAPATPTAETPIPTIVTVSVEHLPHLQMLALSALLRSISREQPQNPAPPRGEAAGDPQPNNPPPPANQPTPILRRVPARLDNDPGEYHPGATATIREWTVINDTAF